mmetsp:Transcript_2359/g.3200  ORF Transcript_2359/g.3200 Transcript_2359/m.3200 type:complete len:252 (+) Transcript_2359:611-1366(+)
MADDVACNHSHVVGDNSQREERLLFRRFQWRNVVVTVAVVVVLLFVAAAVVVVVRNDLEATSLPFPLTVEEAFLRRTGADTLTAAAVFLLLLSLLLSRKKGLLDKLVEDAAGDGGAIVEVVSIAGGNWPDVADLVFFLQTVSLRPSPELCVRQKNHSRGPVKHSSTKRRGGAYREAIRCFYRKAVIPSVCVRKSMYGQCTAVVVVSIRPRCTNLDEKYTTGDTTTRLATSFRYPSLLPLCLSSQSLNQQHV